MPAIQLEDASDLQLVNRAREGDDLAFEEIVRRYGKRVFQIASRFFRLHSDIEEIAQDVFLKAYTQLSSYEGRGSFEGWLGRITANTCLNALRAAKRHPQELPVPLTESESDWLKHNLTEALDLSQNSVENNLIAADLADKLLGLLSPEDRLVVLLLDGDEFSVGEVAAITGWSQSKVKVQAFRARRRMRKAMNTLITRDSKKGI